MLIKKHLKAEIVFAVKMRVSTSSQRREFMLNAYFSDVFSKEMFTWTKFLRLLFC